VSNEHGLVLTHILGIVKMKKKIFDEKLSKAIGERVSKLRKSKGINQEEVIKVLQIDRSTYAKIESGQIMMGTKYVIKLSELFGVSTDFLLTGKSSLRIPDLGKNCEEVGSMLNFMVDNPSFMHHILSEYYAKLEEAQQKQKREETK
jgi:transcriptional regulator with XRE-family HTH domain